MNAPDPGGTTDVVLPADLTIGRVVRGVIRERVDLWGLPDDVAHRAMIVATELASNALLHAAPPYLLRLSTDELGVRVAIRDSLALTPSLRQYDVLALTGRGLRLVADCSTSWGVEASEEGKEVWAEVAFHGDRHTPPPMQISGLSQSGERDGQWAENRAMVRFLGVPVDAYLALQEWNDAVVRECELIAALEPASPHLPPRLLELAARLAGRFAAERDGYRDIVARARAEGTAVVDLDAAWPQPAPASVEAADAFLAMMEELDGFCQADILLSEPPDPVVVRLRRWFVTEMRAQLVDRANPVRFDPSDDQQRV